MDANEKKKRLDQMIENSKETMWICCECVEEHYKKESDAYRPMYVYPGQCWLCGQERSCVSNEIWRSAIYRFKSIEWLIERFEKDMINYWYAASGHASHTQSANSLRDKLIESSESFDVVCKHFQGKNPKDNTDENEREGLIGGWLTVFRQIVEFWPRVGGELQLLGIPSKNPDDWILHIKNGFATRSTQVA